jgi:hypothetical protein
LAKYVTFYCDDLVVYGNSPAECLARLQETKAALIAAHWRINHAKTTAPAQVLSILGVRFDLRNKTTRLAKRFRNSLLSALLTFSSSTHATKKAVASICGKINWGSAALPGLSALSNPILATMVGVRRWRDLVDLGPEHGSIRASIHGLAQQIIDNPWSSFRALHDGAARYWTDASSHYLGIIGPQGTYTRVFQGAERPLHIDCKEAIALVTACDHAYTSHHDAVFLTDSKSLMQAIQKGRSHNAHYNNAALRFARARRSGLAWKVQWVSTHVNPADIPTRPERLPPGFTHPECIIQGQDARVPTGWSSPRLNRLIARGLIVINSIDEAKMDVTWL